MNTNLPLLMCSEDDLFNPLLLESIQSYHQDTEDNFVKPALITFNPKKNDTYHHNTVRWMINQENKAYTFKSSGSPFTGGILADVLNEDKQLEMISLIMANTPPTIFYYQKVLLDCRSEPIKSNLPIPLYSKCIISKLNSTLNLQTDFNLFTKDRSHIIIDCLSKRLSKNNFESKPKLACYCKKILANRPLIICEMCGEAQHKCCVEYNPRMEGGLPYLCLSCWTLNDPIQCRATLIIVPDFCLELWNQVIQGAVYPAPKCFIYNGIQSCNFIQPTIFNNFDVVLTTYSKIMKDLNYGKHVAEDQDTIGLRDLKKDSYPQSPLLCIKWWRICLDQPQSFKSNIDEIFKIVSCLKSAHKWVMPGLSIQESSKSLFSILKYFNVYPDKCRDYKNFIQFMKNETENTFIWFSKLIWYNSIKNINSELSLPKPIHVINWLTFSKLEEFFHEQSKSSLVLMSPYIRNGEKSDLCKKLKYVDCKIKLDVVGRINSLIEACVVPIISSKDEVKINGTFNVSHKIDIRIRKLRADCNELLHQYISKVKCIANIYSFIPKCSKETITHFNMIFYDMEKYHKKQQLTVGTDYEIIGWINEFITFLKEDPDHETYSGYYTIPYLENLSLNFEANILNVHTNNILHDQKIVRLTLAETMKITEIDSLSCNDWWVHILKCISSPPVFLLEVKKSIDDNRKVGTPNIVNKLKSLEDVNFILTKWLTDTLLTRNTVLSTYKMLDERSNGFLIESQFTCTEAGCIEKNGNKCLFCELGRQLCYYKKFVFNNNIDIINICGINSPTKSNQEQIISQHEILLKSLILCETNNIVTDDYLKTATERVKILNILKSEFLNILKLWSNLDKYNEARKLIIKAKLKLTIDDVLVNINDPRYSIKRKKKNLHVDISSYLYLKSEIPFYLYGFQTTYARLLTLDKLNFVNYEISAKCDACATVVEEYTILYCTHVLCSSCLIEAFKKINSSRLTCKLCRMLNSIKCLERVKLNQEPDAQLIGSYCTKLESIVNNLKKVIDLDESIKVMIFSSFEKSLDCLSSALSLNSINFMRLNLKEKNITTVLNTFQNSENMTTILINLQTGLNNLKLNFVTRVFFMDPIIDKSFENQIVDQICSKQMKQTYVHHFIHKNSIEEKVANTFTYDDLSLGINVTLDQLSKLLKDEYNSQTD